LLVAVVVIFLLLRQFPIFEAFVLVVSTTPAVIAGGAYALVTRTTLNIQSFMARLCVGVAVRMHPAGNFAERSRWMARAQLMRQWRARAAAYGQS